MALSWVRVLCSTHPSFFIQQDESAMIHLWSDTQTLSSPPSSYCLTDVFLTIYGTMSIPSPVCLSAYLLPSKNGDSRPFVAEHTAGLSPEFMPDLTFLFYPSLTHSSLLTFKFSVSRFISPCGCLNLLFLPLSSPRRRPSPPPPNKERSGKGR